MSNPSLSTDEGASFGIAARALVKMTMGHMRARGLMSRDDGVVVIDAALVLLEGLDSEIESGPLALARRLLESSQREWHAFPEVQP